MSAARPAYGLPDVAVADEPRRVVGSVLPLVILVLGLAAATIWFVALPALDKQPAGRTCEVVVLKSGSTACVDDPTRASQALPRHSSSRTRR